MSDTTHIEEDLAATRARLGTHLDELTRRLSPGQLLDEGLAYLRTGQGAEFARNLGTQVRDNPLPVTIAGVGLAWLAVSSSLPKRSTSRALVKYDRAPTGAYFEQESLADRARRAAETVTRRSDETQQAFNDRVADAQAKVLGVTRQAQETASAFADRVRQALHDARDSASDMMGRASDTASDWTDSASRGLHQARSAAGDMLERGRQGAGRAGEYAGRLTESGASLGAALSNNPLLLAAFGMTAGALLGALLPPTETEQGLVGEQAGRVTEMARDMAGDVMERGAEVAKAAANAGYQAAQDQGLTPGGRKGDGQHQGDESSRDRPSMG